MTKKISLSDKIFIAGGTGMVGSAILRCLKRKGYGQKINNGSLLAPTRGELDLLDKNQVFNWFKNNNPSVVVIAAAKVGGIYANSTRSADFLLENIKIQTNIIETAWNFKVKRLLFLGSSCIYPKFAPQPIKEEYLLTGELEQTNESYAISKIAGIKLCESLRYQYNFDAISLMPTNLYGTNDNYNTNQSHVMPALIQRFCQAKKNSSKEITCWGTGKPMREFLHVDDLGEAAVFVLEEWDPGFPKQNLDQSNKILSYLNVGTGLEISISDLVKKIANKTGFKGKIQWDNSKPDGTPRKRLSIEKIKNLGWEPKISLDNGIEKTIKEYEKRFV